MKQKVAIALIIVTILATSSSNGFAQSGSAGGREMLTGALEGARLPNTGAVTKVEAITDGGDLAAAQAQKAAMAQVKRSLAEATANAVSTHAGYRAVSATPGRDGGRPVAEVTLVPGDDWKVVTERLD